MGYKDFPKLHEIYKVIQKLKKENNWIFNFRVDGGHYETGLVFNHETRDYRPVNPRENWNDIKYPEEVKCPDLLCLELHGIIEYEENTGPPRSGARLAKKGHGFRGDLPNKRDENRNTLYSKHFKVFQIYQDETDYEEDLESFLRQISQQEG